MSDQPTNISSADISLLAASMKVWTDFMVTAMTAAVNLVSQVETGHAVTDEDGPKKQKRPRQLSAYAAFLKANMTHSDPDSHRNTMTECSEMWKRLSEAEQAKWKLEADRLNAERALLPPKEEKPKRVKKEKRHKDPDAPKRPTSAFLYFAEEYRSKLAHKHPEMKMSDVSKLLGERWKALKPESKRVYEDKAAASRYKYSQELEAYYETHPDKKKKPKKSAPMNGYRLFTSELRAAGKLPSGNASKAATYAGAEWAKLSDAQKQKYMDKAKQVNEARKAAPGGSDDDDNSDAGSDAGNGSGSGSGTDSGSDTASDSE